MRQLAEASLAPGRFVDSGENRGSQRPPPQTAGPLAGGIWGRAHTRCAVLSSEGPRPSLPGRLPGPRSGKDCSRSSESFFLWLPCSPPSARDCPSQAGSIVLGRFLCWLASQF